MRAVWVTVLGLGLLVPHAMAGGADAPSAAAEAAGDAGDGEVDPGVVADPLAPPSLEILPTGPGQGFL